LDYQTPTEFVAGWEKELTTGARVSRWNWSDKTRQVKVTYACSIPLDSYI
jgi:hypothetical protein